MGFTYTFASICGDRFSNWIPRNGSIPLHSVSIVNFTEECALLSVSKKLDAVSILRMMVSVSSTYLRPKEGSLPSRSRFFSMWDMQTLASKGPRGNPIATPSVCSYRAPLNWNSCSLVATLRRFTRSDLVRFKSYVVLNQLFVKALFARSCIVSSNGTLVNREETSYEIKMSSFAISNLRISFVNSKMSVTV